MDQKLKLLCASQTIGRFGFLRVMHVDIRYIYYIVRSVSKNQNDIYNLQPTRDTTGTACFAEDLRLCRGPNLGHSAKTLFAEGQTQEPSAKNGPRQRGLCRGYDPRQRQVLGKSNLYRGPRPSAKMSSTN